MNISRENRKKNAYMLKGLPKKNGFDFWRHIFTGYNKTTGEAKTFFVEYFIINPGLYPRDVVLGQEHRSDQKKRPMRPSYVMVKAGAWGQHAKQLNVFFPCGELQIGKHGLDISIGNCRMSETEISGAVVVTPEKSANSAYMTSAGSMEWQLAMQKNIPYNVGYPTSFFFRTFRAAEMNWHVQGVKTQYNGTVRYDGSEYIVRPHTSFGYAGKSWGSDFINPWLWLAGSNLVSLISGKRLENSCFAVGGGMLKLFGFEYPRRLLVFLHYEGKKYEFSPFRLFSRNAVSYDITENDDLMHWSITAQNKKYLVDFEIYCKKEEMFFLAHESPAGLAEHRTLRSGGTGSGEIRIFKKVKKTLEIIEQARIENCGCEYGEHK